MTTTTDRLLLSGPTFTILWEQLSLGPLPRALFRLSPGATRAERAEAEHAAAAELTRLGAGDQLAPALRLLARPDVECYGWFVPAGGSPVGVLGAASGRQTVLAWQDPPVVGLMPVESVDLTRTVVEQLPPHVPATRRVVLAEHTARAFEYAVRDTISGHGQLFVAVRDRLGRRRQPASGVEYVDTAHGRWLLCREDGVTTVVPGADDAIAAELARRLRVI